MNDSDPVTSKFSKFQDSQSSDTSQATNAVTQQPDPTTPIDGPRDNDPSSGQTPQSPSPSPQPEIEETPIQPTAKNPSQEKPSTPPSQPLTLKSTPPPQIKKSPFKLVTTLVILLIVALLIYFGYNFYSDFLPSPQPSQTPQETLAPSPPTDPYQSWNSHTSSFYQVRYPADINASILPENTLLLTKKGPTQSDQTELFDGISLTISPVTLENQTLLEYVEDSTEEVLNQEGEITSSIQEITIAELTGFTYSAKNQLEYKKIFLSYSTQSPQILEITDSTIDPGNLGYTAMVEEILNTLTFSLSSSPSPSSDTSSYVCPETEYIDCMPKIEPDTPDPRCNDDFLNWASENCSDFQGAAY